MDGDFITAAPGGCHVWRRGCFDSGYGRLKSQGQTYRANRMVWECVNGPIPDGMLVLHKCDNPPCVNPAHLFLGTHDDNMADMVNKGRASKNLTRPYPQGEMHCNAKLSNDEVEQVRFMYDAGGTSQSRIAEHFGVSQALVSQILRGKHRRIPPSSDSITPPD